MKNNKQQPCTSRKVLPLSTHILEGYLNFKVLTTQNVRHKEYNTHQKMQIHFMVRQGRECRLEKYYESPMTMHTKVAAVIGFNVSRHERTLRRSWREVKPLT